MLKSDHHSVFVNLNKNEKGLRHEKKEIQDIPIGTKDDCCH